MVLYEDYLIIFGGIGNVIHEKNDLVVHNLIKKSWKKISFDLEDDIEIIDYKQNPKSMKKNLSKNGFSHLPRSNTKRNSLKQILDEFSINKNSKENENLFDKKIKTHTFHEMKEKEKEKEKNNLNVDNRSEMKNRPPRSLEKSRGLLNKSSSLLKKSFQNPAEMQEKMNETKKKHLLDQFEIFDEKLKREFLHITPTTEIMKTTIAIFNNPHKDDNDNKKKKIFGGSYEFKKKENFLRINGNAPCPRDGHSAVIIDQKMVIIGGDRHQRQYNDFFECNLKQMLN